MRNFPTQLITVSFFSAQCADRAMLCSQANDMQSLADLAAYVNCDNHGNDGRHARISSWFYWCWNANSGDTGGLVQDDWTTLEWDKLAFLTKIGLRPWHMEWVCAATLPAAWSRGWSQVCLHVLVL